MNQTGFQTVEVKDEASLFNRNQASSIGKKTSIDGANTKADLNSRKPSIDELSA